MAAKGGAGDQIALDDPTLLEETLEELYEHAPAGYLSTLPGGLIARVNETLLSWTGHRREELVGRKRLHDLLAPGARIYYETHYAPLLQMQGSVREIAVELIQADGGRLPVLLNSTLVRDDAGAPRLVRTTVFDATERRRYERELQRARADAETRARAALALAHVTDGVVLVATDGRIDVINAAAERILQVEAPAVVGRLANEAVPGWDVVSSRAPVVDVGATVTATILPLHTGGHERWVAVAGVDAGEGGVVYSVRDVTADHTLERLRGDVVAVVSHELRTPLTGVYGAAQTLLTRGDDLDAETRRQLLEMVVGESERLTRIVDQILVAGRLDEGEIDIGGQPADAAEIVSAACAALTAEQRGRVVVLGDSKEVVRTDEAAARQILENLLENAIKYSDGPVSVETGRVSGAVRFTVSDEGPGIPQGERTRVFEKFYRLDPAQRAGVGGVGLGLFIARELTKLLGGRIGILPVERGTSVFFDLPE